MNLITFPVFWMPIIQIYFGKQKLKEVQASQNLTFIYTFWFNDFGVFRWLIVEMKYVFINTN